MPRKPQFIGAISIQDFEDINKSCTQDANMLLRLAEKSPIVFRILLVHKILQ